MCTRHFLIALLLLAAPAQAQTFDLHVHLHRGEASLKEYEAQVARDGLEITRFGAMWFGGPNQALEGYPDRIRANNDMIIDLAAKNPRTVPVATVHPLDGLAAITELRRVASRGVKILKLHPHTQKFDAGGPWVLALARVAGELGVIVMIDNANILPGDSEKLFNLALAAPKTNFIFAHMGGMNFRFWNILAAARTAENLFGNNIYFDLSMAPLIAGSPIEAEFLWTIRNVGVGQVLLGSDFPQMSLAQNLNALNRMALSDGEKALIRYENARKLGLVP